MAILLSELQNDPRKYRIDGRFFRRTYELCKPYWARREAWVFWVLFALQLVLVVAYTSTGAYLSEMGAQVTNALVGKQEQLYWSLFLLLTLLGVVRFGATLAQEFVWSYLNQHWWQWLTAHFIDEYLAKRTYFELTLDDRIDNPDQRIQEEVQPLCNAVTGIPSQLIGSLLDMSVQGFILMSISPGMFLAVIIYSVLQMVLMFYLYRPTIKQNYDITVAEADLRYGLTHVRDNAESIAFYQGEPVEREHLGLRMRNATVKQMRLIIYGLYMGGVNQVAGIVWTLLPLVILVPLFFAGSIDYGTIGQATLSAGMLLGSLSALTNFIPALTQTVPRVIRLAEIHEKFIELGQRASDPDSGLADERIHSRDGATIELTKLSLKTPGAEQALVHNLNLSLDSSARLVIVGRTGVGKSSLLRAIAGLWSRGQGSIRLPMGERECLFLPQRPYTFRGSLRAQLTYPLTDSPVSDEHLTRLLDEVLLEQLLSQHGDLDTVKDWSRVLSLGEQQRIAFARVLLIRPRYLFLDEATSAVDTVTEARLYQRILDEGFGYVSIGHRQSLLGYHDQALRLLEQGAWQLLPAAQVRLDASEADL